MLPEQADYYENFDLESIVTPVNVERYAELLAISGYDKKKSDFLIDGFKHGFSIGYSGSMKLKRTAPNLRLRVGNETVLWNKVMKEVKLKRYAGPYAKPPFEFFVQSPIGLVPKDGGHETHLIFHLSYPRSGNSINSETPVDICKVKYCKFDDAIRHCLEEGVGCHISCSDFSAAFRNLGIKPEHWPLLMMKAKSPIDGKWYYFIDKCLPFGASISCAHFQAFSDSVAHVVQYYTKKKVTNYLDNFLFAVLLKWLCDHQVNIFLWVCREIQFPVNLDKTFWGTMTLTFLGLLIDTIKQLVCVPVDKVNRATDLIRSILMKKKLKVHELQRLCGYLNFLYRAVVPGRAFTRQLYAYTAGKMLKPHHHVQITGEMRADLSMWMSFLGHPSAYCRPFMDFKLHLDAQDVDFHTDSSQNFSLGFGGIFDRQWFWGRWDNFTAEVEPSIEYLELYAVTAGVLLWGSQASE